VRVPIASLSESLSSLLAATVAIAIGTSVVLRDRAREQFVLFAVFCFNLALFHLARFFFGFSGLGLFGWFAQTISLLLPWSAERCFSSFVPATGGRDRARLQSTLVVVLVVAQTAALVFPPITAHEAWVFVPYALWAYVVVGLLFAAQRMWRAARAARGTAVAPRLRYLYYASVAALALGSPAVPFLGPIVTAVYLYFVAQTLVRERLLDLPEVAGRIASAAIMVVIVTALYALLLLWIPARSGGSLFLFNAAVASFAVIVLFDPVRTEVESRVEAWLFRERTVLRAVLLRLRQRLLNVIDPDEMATLVVEELAASNRVTRVALYILDRRGTSLTLRASLGDGGDDLARLDLATRRPLLERMRSDGPQVRDILQREIERASPDEGMEIDDALALMRDVGASLAVPILGRMTAASRGAGRAGAGRGVDLLGALFVDDERLLEPFSREEIALFEGVAAQAATTVQNSAVYEERKERDRLAALGEMAAGLAHEIRNPLGAIKGAVQIVAPNLEHHDPVEREFLQVIVEEVDRLNRVVSQFLTYSRPFAGELERVDLAKVVEATVRLLPEDRRARVTLGAGLGAQAPASRAAGGVRGDPEALRQVLLNLLINAFDAADGDRAEEASSPRKGRVWLDLHDRARGLRGSDAVALSVRDDGPGLSPHTLTNLFVPFHTTKSGGTGLGLPISQRIVENHRGVIEVGNAPEGGAEFTVVLPMDEAERVAPATADDARGRRPAAAATATADPAGPTSTAAQRPSPAV
jgi:signal transduction histidine kinase